MSRANHLDGRGLGSSIGSDDVAHICISTNPGDLQVRRVVGLGHIDELDRPVYGLLLIDRVSCSSGDRWNCG